MKRVALTIHSQRSADVLCVGVNKSLAELSGVFISLCTWPCSGIVALPIGMPIT